MNSPKLDKTEAHKYFSSAAFNAAWDLLDKLDRTAADEEKMLLRSMASVWHWTQRPECTQQNLSIGYWQISRIHAVCGRAGEARRYAEHALEASRGDEIAPSAKAYAYEALARAEAVAGNADKRDGYVAKAREAMKTITDNETQKMLADDLATIP